MRVRSWRCFALSMICMVVVAGTKGFGEGVSNSEIESVMQAQYNYLRLINSIELETTITTLAGSTISGWAVANGRSVSFPLVTTGTLGYKDDKWYGFEEFSFIGPGVRTGSTNDGRVVATVNMMGKDVIYSDATRSQPTFIGVDPFLAAFQWSQNTKVSPYFYEMHQGSYWASAREILSSEKSGDDTLTLRLRAVYALNAPLGVARVVFSRKWGYFPVEVDTFESLEAEKANKVWEHHRVLDCAWHDAGGTPVPIPTQVEHTYGEMRRKYQIAVVGLNRDIPEDRFRFREDVAGLVYVDRRRGSAVLVTTDPNTLAEHSKLQKVIGQTPELGGKVHVEEHGSRGRYRYFLAGMLLISGVWGYARGRKRT